MLGQAVSLDGKKYNVIILAGGSGTRLGVQSDYIPKALSQIGSKRAIDYIIERHLPIAHKTIVGISRHADMLKGYVEGRFSPLPVEFSKEDEPINNAISLMYCLDHANVRYGTLVTFCDLLTIGNPIIEDNSVLVASTSTRGVVGTFRHVIVEKNGESIVYSKSPAKPTADERGVLGYYVFGDTRLLKSIVYSIPDPQDITEDFLTEYMSCEPIAFNTASMVYEFGTENDLAEVRKMWEDA